MDTIKKRFGNNPGNWGFIQNSCIRNALVRNICMRNGDINDADICDACICESWEQIRGVYRIKLEFDGISEGQIPSSESFILKELRQGIVKAFLTGELLAAAGRFFKNEGFNAGVPLNGDSTLTGSILPSLIKSANYGNYFWFRGRRFLLTGLLKGREADYHQTSDLQAAIGAMKIFHHFSRQLITSQPHRWSLLNFDIMVEWRKRLQEMDYCREMALRMNNDWSRRYLEYWSDFYDQARQVISELQNLNADNQGANGKVVICYHDWAHHNVIIYENKAFLIDFDYIIVDRPVHDRSNLISRYLRLNQWSLESLHQIISDFDRIYPWQPGELHWLWIYLVFPYEFWMLGRQYFIEKQPWSIKYYQDQWERKIAFREMRAKVLESVKTMAQDR